MITFKSQQVDGMTLLEFEIEGGVTTPDEAAKAVEGLHVPYKQGVVISGRGPVWLYAMLVHEFHPAQWVATHDPRLGAVVVQSHTPGVGVGDILQISWMSPTPTLE